MRIEAVVGSRVSVWDIEANEGAATVLVLANSGVPVLADVEVTLVPQGRGRHSMLVCGTCGRGRRELFAINAALVCRVCGCVRTRHQLSKNRRDWRIAGHALEDEFLRAIVRAHGRPSGVRRIRLIADALAQIDADRVRSALEHAAEALGELSGSFPQPAHVTE